MINTLTLLRPVKVLQTASVRAGFVKALSLAGNCLLAFFFFLVMAAVYVTGLLIRTREKPY